MTLITGCKVYSSVSFNINKILNSALCFHVQFPEYVVRHGKTKHLLAILTLIFKLMCYEVSENYYFVLSQWCDVCKKSSVLKNLIIIIINIITILITEALDKQLRIKISDINCEWRFDESFIIFKFVKTKKSNSCEFFIC